MNSWRWFWAGLLVMSSAWAATRAPLGESRVMKGKESRFSLEDPRVALIKIKEARGLGEKLTKGEPAAVAVVDDLQKAYAENKFRGDGFGFEINLEIIKTLGTIQSKRSVAFLGALLNSDREIIELKADMVEALLQIGDAGAVPALRRHLQYLTEKKPDDPLAGHAYQTWIDRTREAILQLGGDEQGRN